MLCSNRALVFALVVSFPLLVTSFLPYLQSVTVQPFFNPYLCSPFLIDAVFFFRQAKPFGFIHTKEEIIIKVKFCMEALSTA